MTAHRMPRLLIDSFREGMLAVIGHDLRLEAQRFEVRATGGDLAVRVELESLRVLGAMIKGKLDTSAPSPGDRADIEQRVQREILGTAQSPQASLNATVRADGAGWMIAGTLTLCARAQPMSARVARVADALEARVELVPSRFGIAPFRALGGALRIADRVVVNVQLPLEAASPGSDLEALSASWQRGER